MLCATKCHKMPLNATKCYKSSTLHHKLLQKAQIRYSSLQLATHWKKNTMRCHRLDRIRLQIAINLPQIAKNMPQNRHILPQNPMNWYESATKKNIEMSQPTMSQVCHVLLRINHKMLRKNSHNFLHISHNLLQICHTSPLTDCHSLVTLPHLGANYTEMPQICHQMLQICHSLPQIGQRLDFTSPKAGCDKSAGRI